MNIRFSQSAKNRILRLKIASAVYWLIFLGAIWTIAFGLTGNVFRASLCTLAFVLTIVAYGQYQRFSQDARIVQMMLLITDFDQEMNGTRTIIGKAGEKIKGGDSVYIDPITGEVKKTK